MRLAYADPPYIGCAERIYGDLHPDAAVYDDPQAHLALMRRLNEEFDGWALNPMTKYTTFFPAAGLFKKQ